jgi:hypothetical protein
VFIIVKNLPTTIDIDQLEDYVAPSLKGRFLQKKGHLRAIKIIELLDRKRKPVERHGLLRVYPDNIKKRVIRSLKHRLILGLRYAVDEYVIRHWSNDRRLNTFFTPAMSPTKENRRNADRRRRGLRMVTVAEKVGV